MAKALGLIGNFKGKLGNTVGYSLKDSNNKQTQGVRVYQPVVRNPKTAAQAEQRAKLAPINATYRVLKMVIDRGQEGKAYGNKSRLAWLSAAMKAFDGGWFEKNKAIVMPAIVPLTKGSLGSPVAFIATSDGIRVDVTGVTEAGTTKIGQLSAALIADYGTLKEGDQITFASVIQGSNSMAGDVQSFVLDTTSTENIPSFIEVSDGNIVAASSLGGPVAVALIVSREGDNGAHLRSNTELTRTPDYDTTTLAEPAKQAAIESYMSQGANTDWAEESLM